MSDWQCSVERSNSARLDSTKNETVRDVKRLWPVTFRLLVREFGCCWLGRVAGRSVFWFGSWLGRPPPPWRAAISRFFYQPSCLPTVLELILETPMIRSDQITRCRMCPDTKKGKTHVGKEKMREEVGRGNRTPLQQLRLDWITRSRILDKNENA